MLPAYEPCVAKTTVCQAAEEFRVLAIDQSGVLGGAELSLLEIVRARSVHFEVVLFDDGPFRTELDKVGVDVRVLAAGALSEVRKQGGTLPIGRTLKGVAALLRATVMRARHADVIYANTQRAMVIGALAGWLTRRPVVWHLRDIVSSEHFGRKQLQIIKWCAKLGLAHVIANSVASARAFVELTSFDAERVNVIFNGIPSAPFDALRNVPVATLRDRMKLPRDAFLVGSFSRLALWKGQRVLLEAMVLNPHMHAVLVGAPLFGEDAYEAELRDFVASHELGKRVHFLGFQSDIAACMLAVDVIAHTSIRPEPFGRVIAEGMLARRPVVAARAGGALEIVEDGVNGLLCLPGDANALACTLAELHSDPALRERLSANGYRTARARFGTVAYVSGVERILGNVAGRNKAT
ncbi:MAG: glycosyltransferase family 4 protein [Rhodanobacter sp.]